MLRRQRGFKHACVVRASAAGEPGNLPAIAEQSFAMKEAHMRIAEIDWPLFWQALTSLDPATRDHWLSRWVFADDAVKLSRQPAGDARRRL
jgi:hypothetical protein